MNWDDEDGDFIGTRYGLQEFKNSSRLVEAPSAASRKETRDFGEEALVVRWILV